MNTLTPIRESFGDHKRKWLARCWLAVGLAVSALLSIRAMPHSPLRGCPDLRQHLVLLPRDVHRNLHKAFDAERKEFRRNLGWRNIYNKLYDGEVTPAELFDWMEDVTKRHLTGAELDQALGELRRLRKLF